MLAGRQFNVRTEKRESKGVGDRHAPGGQERVGAKDDFGLAFRTDSF